MNVLIIGSGGREHAFCWKLRQSPIVSEIYCAPGNGGTSGSAINIKLNITKHQEVIACCKEKKIDLVVVGPEAPLAIGIADDLESAGIKVFGPAYAAARMESSKIFAKEIMGKYNVPTASFRIFDDFEKAKDHIMSEGAPIVVKAYGLAAGKGVIVADTVEEAVSAARGMLVEKVFGAAGHKIIVEECLKGEEVSILVVTDGTNVIPLATSQDHKRVFNNDKGPNTGGMGAYSPAPLVDESMLKDIMENIISPTIKGLYREGIEYKGVLYAGIMVTDAGPKVLEYNVRFGDPETQAILPRMKSDLAELMLATAEGDISGKTVEWDERSCVCVVLAAGGYPEKYENGKVVTGCDEAVKEGALVFHAGTELKDGNIVTSGGRVLNVVAKGHTIKDAIDNTYRAVKKVQFEGMHYRRDIGRKALVRAELA